MHDYTPSAKFYWWTTFVLGAIVLGLSVVQVAALPANAVVQVLAGAAMAAFTGLFPVRIPGRKTSIAGAEIFVFLLLLLYGPGAAALAAAAEAAVGSYRTSKRVTSRLGSPAMAALAIYGCGSAFTLAVGAGAIPAASPGIAFVMLLMVAVAYFACSTLLMASLLSLKQGQPVRPIAMLRDHAWLALAFAGSASIAGLVYATHGIFGDSVLLVVAPIIAMFLSTVHLFFRQLETDQRAAAEASRHVAALQASERRFHSAFTHAAVGMVLLSREGRVLQTNQALSHQLGRSEPELVGRDVAELVHPEDIDMLRREMREVLAGTSAKFAAELRCVHSDGEPVWVAANGALFSAEGSDEHCMIMQLQDVTGRKRAEARLRHIAFHDGLTDLPNRSYFLGELARAVAEARCDPDARFAVMFLDFDRFKTINDSLGHGAGDELLTTSARRLKRCLRPGDIIARLGGDEFAILVEGFHSEDEVTELAERIQTVLCEPVGIAGAEVTTSASIGITTSALHYVTPEDVMRDADIAMYAAKGQGKARYALFDRAAHVELASQLWMEGELRRAVEHGHITIDFQPIFDLRTQQLYGFEALARWPHAERGLMLPDQFIALAEETGLIVGLGNHVLELACAYLGRWRSTLPNADGLRLHVNVSPVQLAQPGYALRALHIIKASGVPFECVTLEVTESVFVGRLEAALPNLRQLYEMGVGVSVDDFGKGYSSLSAVEDLPIGEFKIDRSFVDRLARGKGRAVVNAILALGRSMGKHVVVEGIETTAQLEQLLQLGCERGQGFLLGRPAAPESAERLLREAASVVRVAHAR